MSVFFYNARQKWAVNYTENGKKKRKLFATEKEAHAFLADLNESQEEPERYTLSEIAIKFFKYRENYNRETRKKIVYLLSGYEKNGVHIPGAGEFLIDKYADTLSRKDLERLRDNIKKSGRASNKTCNKFQAYIKAMLQWAVEQEYLVINPWRDLKRLPETPRIFTATLDQFKAIISHAPEWLQWAFYTAYACSLRFGQVELFSLAWQSFNWQNGCVTLRQGKSGRIKKVYPPQEYMRQAYQRYQNDMANGIVLVCHRNGQKVLSYMPAWKKALKAAGLEKSGIRPYDIRHIAATEMLNRGIDPATVASQLGHSTPATTMNFYAHTSVSNQKRAGETLPSLSGERSEHE